MDRNAIVERGKALEDAFFRKQDAKLKEKLEREATKQQLCQASGIADDKALDALVAEGVTCSTLTALTLVPLIHVAWADRMMNERERKAVLKAAHEVGIGPDSDAYALVESWLDHRPPSALIEAWEESVAATLPKLDEVARAELREACLGRAHKVAEATGGILAIGRVSAVEREALERIEKAFA
jgi:hypothetical protein